MLKACARAAKHLLPRSICVLRLRRKAGATVLLTFDDGPPPQTTPAVLDRLKTFDARAVFFVVGDRIPRAPDMLKRIVDGGHFLGNHTFTHPLDRGMRYREYLDDLVRCQDEVFRHARAYPRFHRPPLGQLSLASVLAPKRLGLVTLMWSCSAEDWRFRSDDAAMERAEELSAEVQSRDVLLFHDERLHTVAAMDFLLPRLKSRGLGLSPDAEDLL
jgi:peptidoglycan-N-acetylglucosamine deacetylase